MSYSDDIADAPDISGGADATWDNLTATDNTSEPGIYGLNVWQKVYLSAAGGYDFSHDTAPDGDTVMAIYTGPPAATYADLTVIGYGDDEAGNLKPLIRYISAGSEWVYIGSTGYGAARVSGQATLVVPVDIGHWSAWQPPWAMPFPVTLSSHETMFWGSQRFNYDSYSGGSTDTAVLMAYAIANIKAGGGDAEGSYQAFRFRALHVPAGGGGGETDEAHAGVGYYSATYLGSALADTLSTGMPPSLPVYADTIPLAFRGGFTVDDRVQYESGSTTFAGWRDSDPHTTSFTADPQDTYGTNFVPPANVGWVVGVTAPLSQDVITGRMAGAPPSPDPNDGATVHRGPVLAYSDLLVVAEFTTLGRSTGVDAPYATSGLPETLDTKDVVLEYSAVTFADFSVLPMMSYMGSDIFPAPTLGSGYEDFIFHGYLGEYVGAPKQMFSGAPSPVVLYTSPRWRYWIPPGTGPKLRTVGGHWASVGGAVVNMMQADMTWIPVQDGV